jgi:hypothetical protein
MQFLNQVLGCPCIKEDSARIIIRQPKSETIISSEARGQRDGTPSSRNMQELNIKSSSFRHISNSKYSPSTTFAAPVVAFEDARKKMEQENKDSARENTFRQPKVLNVVKVGDRQSPLGEWSVINGVETRADHVDGTRTVSVMLNANNPTAFAVRTSVAHNSAMRPHTYSL